jgi:2-polyprenyl-3-methyl-5-hydroxy-6-metoxy-1,4-benzoquinol methylase
VLGEQIEYYRARAPEYEQWFCREGRYDRGEEARAAWFAEIATVREAVARLPIDDADVLELAPGTGIWTSLLAARAARLTVVDAAPEMLAENRRRLGPLARRVEYVLADLFEWRPTRRFDAVVFCFWISHVPEIRLDGFLTGVADMLRPDGAVFFLDGLPEPTSTAADHVLPAPGHEVMTRRLDDGREYRIVKAYRRSAELERRCRQAGLDVQVRETPTYFPYGIGRVPPSTMPRDAGRRSMR